MQHRKFARIIQDTIPQVSRKFLAIAHEQPRIAQGSRLSRKETKNREKVISIAQRDLFPTLESVHTNREKLRAIAQRDLDQQFLQTRLGIA